MADFLYQASFFLYEIGFLLLALALVAQAEVSRRLTRILRLPPVWIFSLAAAGLLLLCAGIHFYAYHALSPRYLSSGAQDLLVTMYALKMISMCSLFLAGTGFLLGIGWYLLKTA